MKTSPIKKGDNPRQGSPFVSYDRGIIKPSQRGLENPSA